MTIVNTIPKFDAMDRFNYFLAGRSTCHCALADTPKPILNALENALNRRDGGFSLVELVVVIFLIGVLMGLLLPAVQSGRESARRMSCQVNLRQVGIALHNFESVFKRFPSSGWTESGPGNPAGKYVGWRALALPFLEQANTQKLYDFDSHWWEGTNAAVAAIPIKAYQCPSVPQHAEVLQAIAKPPRPALTFANAIAATDYEAIMGVKPASINSHLSEPLYNNTNRFAVLYRNSTTTFGHITDGSSQTIMIVECGGRPVVYHNRVERPNLDNDQGIGWADSEGSFSLDGARRDGSAEGCGPDEGCTISMNAKNDNEPFSFHRIGSNLLFADGHVIFLNEQIDLLVMAALCTKSAGDGRLF